MKIILSSKTEFVSNRRIVSPARKVPRRHNGVSGKHPSVKNQKVLRYESTLERDFMLSLEFDLEVDSFVEQPLTIYYHKVQDNEQAIRRNLRYTPDLVIYYYPHLGRRPAICEVKPERLLIKNADEYLPKFMAAELFCTEHGFDFLKVTEKSVPAEFVSNINDLYPHKIAEPKVDSERKIRDFFLAHQDRCVKAGELFSRFDGDPEFGDALRRLIADGQIKTDLRKTICRESIFHMEV